MRKIIYSLLFLLTILYPPYSSHAQHTPHKVSVIIEVEGDPEEHKEYLMKSYPSIEVIALYEILLNGLAFKIEAKEAQKISSLPFIKEMHLAKKYEANPYTPSYRKEDKITFPKDLNPTPYTGKNVKVAVIDTGIDYDHHDLSDNYVGGFDTVDLDDDPMETLEERPTKHGTHVAGIIAANGDLQGVAPDAQIYAYRALGPGGVGSSIQVIAAMEQALKDGVDLMNLSLGNSVNGPDYPTSKAVDRAIELGVIVVIANGNSGPDDWTVGAPATATKALSVGALRGDEEIPYLYEPFQRRAISFQLMQGSVSWQLKKSYLVVDAHESEEKVDGNIAIASRDDKTFYEKGLQAQEKGAVALLIANNEEGIFYGSIENNKEPLKIPVAAISEEDGQWLMKKSLATHLYVNTHTQSLHKGVASFSSRGPVTLNWHIKPEILAPGTNVISTVTGGGYEILDGTSMAAPHVSGAIAVMKEAHPNWNQEQIIGALLTTAERLYEDRRQQKPITPVAQGIGEIQLEQAIETNTIIYNPMLNFGRMKRYRETDQVKLTIENTTNRTLRYTFQIPKKEKGLTWKLPLSFEVKPKSIKEIPLELQVTSPLVDKGMMQGWLTLTEGSNEYHLPYLFINQRIDIPIVEGFEISPIPFSKEEMQYKLYVTGEEVHKIEVHLYHPDTFIYDRKLIEFTQVKKGLNEGKISRKELGEPGIYQAILYIERTNGLYETMEQILWIE